MILRTLNEISETEVSHNAAIKKKVLLSCDEVPGVTNFAKAVFPPGKVAFAHRHADMAEVFFIVSGVGCITVNDERFELVPGMCVTIEPGEEHELANTGSEALEVLYFGVQIQA